MFKDSRVYDKDISISFIEIYNEEITDLLDEDSMSKKLKIYSTGKLDTMIKGLTVINTKSLEYAYECFLKGSYKKQVSL